MRGVATCGKLSYGHLTNADLDKHADALAVEFVLQGTRMNLSDIDLFAAIRALCARGDQAADVGRFLGITEFQVRSVRNHFQKEFIDSLG